MKDKNFYTKLRKLMIPIVIQNLINAIAGSAGVLMLGFVGQDELSGVSLAGQVTFILTLFLFGVTAGVTSLTAQYWGKGDHSSIQKIFGVALHFSLSIAFIFCLLTILIPESIMTLFTEDANMIHHGAVYLRVLSISYLFMGFSQIYEMAIRSMERILPCTVIATSFLLLNIFLNAVFIFGWFGSPKLGVFGVGLAATLARGIEMLLCLLDSVFIKQAVKLRVTYIFKKSGVIIKDFIHYASPALGNYLSWGLGFTMYSVILGRLGTDIVAAHAVNSVVRNLSVSLGLGVSSAGAILIGKEIGHGMLEQAKEDGAKVCRTALLLGATGALIILLCRPFILNIANLSDTSHGYLGIMIVMNVYYCMGKVLNCATISGIFCAGGDTKFGLICDSVNMWCFAVPLGLLAAFVFKWPIMVVYFCISLDEVVKLPFVYLHYKKYRWVNNITRNFE